MPPEPSRSRRLASSSAELLRIILIMVGGGCGAVARFLLDHALGNPLGALTLINLSGSLLLGMLLGWARDRHQLVVGFVGTGFLGGYTTFSTFTVALVSSLASGEGTVPGSLVTYALQVVGGVVLALLGMRLVAAIRS